MSGLGSAQGKEPGYLVAFIIFIICILKNILMYICTFNDEEGTHENRSSGCFCGSPSPINATFAYLYVYSYIFFYTER